ncbi:MAG: hypothetical protein JO103_10945, partial [Candidatus Eremiobacteraeota bacterium]|nr:hypothetical protein [Candidatus Eremiobacteraeota bacterium]
KIMTQGAAGLQLARNLLARSKAGADVTTPAATNGDGAVVRPPAVTEQQ